MRFYTGEHAHYCGIDLHARTMHLCILDAKGQVCFSENVDTDPEAFRAAMRPFREDLVVAVECMFTWYWLADLCAAEGIAFVLGHALYMKAIHGGTYGVQVPHRRIEDVQASMTISYRRGHGSRIEARVEKRGTATEPYSEPISATDGDGRREQAEVSIGHSCRALRNGRDMTKERTSWNKEEP